jgi:hypothetical protein
MKSPTEYELVALMDLRLAELFQEFVEFATKTSCVFQDCNAVVSLVSKGGGITRKNILGQE